MRKGETGGEVFVFGMMMRKSASANIVRERERGRGEVSGERGEAEEREPGQEDGRRTEGGSSRRLTRGSLLSLSLQDNNDLGAEGARVLAPALAALSNLTELWMVSRHCACKPECAMLCWV